MISHKVEILQWEDDEDPIEEASSAWYWLCPECPARVGDKEFGSGEFGMAGHEIKIQDIIDVIVAHRRAEHGGS